MSRVLGRFVDQGPISFLFSKEKSWQTISDCQLDLNLIEKKIHIFNSKQF